MAVFASSHAPLLAFLIASIFALLARSARAVTKSGAIAGAIVCFVLSSYGGYGAFAALVSVFLFAWVTTKVGYRKKERRGAAESSAGRNAAQVFANLGVAATCAIFFAITARGICLLALSAALAEAAGDTVSSEIGQLSDRRARLITTWKEVAPGTDGGVTLTGTISGLLAGAAVTFVCVIGGLVPANSLWIPFLAAWVGTVADSFLGAIAQRRGLLNNNAVNLLGTSIAAFSVLLFCF